MALLPVVMIVSAVSVVIRYRSSPRLQREQIRWLAWSGSVVVVLYTVTLGVSLWYDSAHQVDSSSSSWFAATYPLWLSLLQGLALLSFMLVPAAIGVAILRYQLYEIDRLISRTASYGLVTGSVALTYVVAVTLMSRLVPDFFKPGDRGCNTGRRRHRQAPATESPGCRRPALQPCWLRRRQHD